MIQGRAVRIDQLSLTVADLGRARSFYETLGFRSETRERSLSAGQVEQRFGLAGSTGRAVELRLGAQTIELLAFELAGRTYPRPAAANDPWFQHFAIAVPDMHAAYAVLTQLGAEPISEGGPQRLPPSTGSVTAYKFRDPDGHPLELSYIPGSAWMEAAPAVGGSPFLGIDHTALAVSDLNRSLEFYTEQLGFTLDAQLVNTGPEQDRLDGLLGVALDIAVLRPADPASPHLELLAYRSPRTDRSPVWPQPGDLAATRTRLTVEGPAGPSAEQCELRLAADPDGHPLEFAASAATEPG